MRQAPTLQAGGDPKLRSSAQSCKPSVCTYRHLINQLVILFLRCSAQMTVQEGGCITILAPSRGQCIVGALGLGQEESTAKPPFFRMNSVYPLLRGMELGGGLVALVLELCG